MGDLLDALNDALRQAVQLPPWRELQQKIALSRSDYEDACCSISLFDVADIAQPVAVKNGSVTDIFDYESLKEWLSQSNKHPHNQDKRLTVNDVMRVKWGEYATSGGLSEKIPREGYGQRTPRVEPRPPRDRRERRSRRGSPDSMRWQRPGSARWW